MREIKKRNTEPKQMIFKEDIFSNRISLACNTFLLEKINSVLTSRKMTGDYKYLNLSSVLRSALKAYKDGMILETT